MNLDKSVPILLHGVTVLAHTASPAAYFYFAKAMLSGILSVLTRTPTPAKTELPHMCPSQNYHNLVDMDRHGCRHSNASCYCLASESVTGPSVCLSTQLLFWRFQMGQKGSEFFHGFRG